MSMSGEEPSITLDGASLALPTFIGGREGLASLLLPPKRIYVPILHDIDFEVCAGERVALIGRNGAGKSTLLNVLSGAFPPSSGTVEVRGDVSALLNVGLGFNPEATLLENIYLRAAAMGHPIAFAREIAGEVLDFAELQDVADRRLATLSAGQRMRLGFAISTQTQPEILLLDEWIGTGDDRFMMRAKARMRDRVAGAGIMVLASHNHALLRDTCTRGLVLEEGRIVFDGSVPDAVKVYKGMGGPPPAGNGRPIYVGGGRLSRGEVLGLASLELEKRFENVGDTTYGAAFTSPIGFPVIVDAMASRLAAAGFRLTVVSGTTRIEKITWSTGAERIEIGMIGIRSMARNGTPIQVYDYHVSIKPEAVH